MEPIIGNGSSQHYDVFTNEVKNDTFIACRHVTLSCRAPTFPASSCCINRALSGEYKSTRRQREKYKYTGEIERGGEGGRLSGQRQVNAVSHKHALIRAEGWYNCSGVQIKTERGRDREAGGAMIHTLCSGQVLSSPKSSSVILTTTRTTYTTTGIVISIKSVHFK